ncbi:MAG: S8 family serine peptidase, partial [Limisphaerales bacterium]
MNLRPVVGVLVGLVILSCGGRVGGVEVSGEGGVVFRGEFRMQVLEGWEVRGDGWGRRWRGGAREDRVRLFGVDEGWVGRFGRKVVVGLREGGKPGVGLEYGLGVERELGGGLWLMEAANLAGALEAAAALARQEGVEVSYPAVRWAGDVSWDYAARPEDGLYYAQWYLEGRDDFGIPVKPNLNVRGAWPWGDGSGVVVAVVDLGMELGHLELAGAVAGRPHYDFGRGVVSGGLPEGLSDGLSFYWAHGTEVAGLVGAELGRGRMVGVAPGVGLASWVIFEPDAAWLPGLVDDVALGQMFAYAGGVVGVQNHSWNRKGLGLHGMSPAELDGVYEALVNGRGGRGVVMVRSAGNERLQGCNVNDDQYANLPLMVAVAGVYDDGRVLEESEPGACILVGAPAAFRTTGNPSGLVTTDLTGLRGVNSVGFFPPDEDLSDYVFNSLGFKGTSAAAPLVSGVVALVLSVAPELAVRDVLQVLALSARHFDLSDPDLVTNAAGFRVSHNVGFGVPDAAHAVRLASRWVNRHLAAELRVTAAGVVAVPDDGLRVELRG